jgi:hypothetical protein
MRYSGNYSKFTLRRKIKIAKYNSELKSIYTINYESAYEIIKSAIKNLLTSNIWISADFTGYIKNYFVPMCSRRGISRQMIFILLLYYNIKIIHSVVHKILKHK